MKSAILVDGAFFLRRFRSIYGEEGAEETAKRLHKNCLAHLCNRDGKRLSELYRMRIGIDIASLVFKRQVDQIVLISGDSDFVPAAKMARREGIDFVLDPMWHPIRPDLHEHIDGLRSTCPKPGSNAAKEPPPEISEE